MNSTDTDAGGEAEAEAPETQEKPKLSLEIQVETTGSCERHVVIAVSQADVDRYVGDAFDELQPTAQVRGFRPGRAPRKLIESQFKDQVRDQVKHQLLAAALDQMSEEHELAAISEPELDLEAISLPEDGPFKFEFDIEVRPDFEVPEWKGLQLKRLTHEIDDADIDDGLNSTFRPNGKVVVREAPVEPDDTVIADVEVTHDGKTVSTHSDVHLKVAPTVLFKDASLEGFADAMIGAEVGDKKTIPATVSADVSNEELGGQQVDVTLTIKEIRYLKIPEITEDFLAQFDDGQFDSLDDLRETVRASLERRVAYEQRESIRSQIAETLTRNAGWELPPDLLRRQANRELDRYVMELRSAGFDEENIQVRMNSVRQRLIDSTASALRQHFVFERIAENEEIDADEQDYDNEIAAMAARAGESPRRIRARLEKRGQLDVLRNQIVEGKVIDLICQYAEFEDVPTERKKDESTAVDLRLTGERDTSSIPVAKHEEGPQALPGSTDRSNT